MEIQVKILLDEIQRLRETVVSLQTQVDVKSRQLEMLEDQLAQRQNMK
jgi:hypothetical protein